MIENKIRGLIQIYTGNGKGKTTAALGLAMRASGHGMKIIMIQFMKGVDSGEFSFIDKYHPFEIVQVSQGDCFIKPEEQLQIEANNTLDRALDEILSLKYDMVILDEIFVALHLNLLKIEQVIDLIDKKPEKLELVLTGRYAPLQIIERADLVTEMVMVKHPFTKGIAARCGIEY
jgi:cob(I)alamin adenosyltransferase